MSNETPTGADLATTKGECSTSPTMQPAMGDPLCLTLAFGSSTKEAFGCCICRMAPCSYRLLVPTNTDPSASLSECLVNGIHGDLGTSSGHLLPANILNPLPKCDEDGRQ